MAAPCLSRKLVLHPRCQGRKAPKDLLARLTQNVAEPMAACHIDRGLHQGGWSGAQTHHAPTVLQIITFLSKYKGSWGAFFNLFDFMEGRRAASLGRLVVLLTPATACCMATEEKNTSVSIKKNRKKSAGLPGLFQGALCSTSPADAVSLGFLAVLLSLFLSAAQRWGVEAQGPEGGPASGLPKPTGCRTPGKRGEGPGRGYSGSRHEASAPHG